jgi:ribosome biogenesis GTPase
VDDAFADIKALSLRCRFTDCGHGNEPGCAVQAALKSGELTLARFESYRKLKAEQAASVPAPKRPSALASKPGWNRKNEGARPFRHRFHEED